MAALAGPAALAMIETLAPMAISALEPVLKNILSKLPAGMVPIVPGAPATNVEAAVAGTPIPTSC